MRRVLKLLVFFQFDIDSENSGMDLATGEMPVVNPVSERSANLSKTQVHGEGGETTAIEYKQN